MPPCYCSRVESTDLTVKILQEIRDDIRGLRDEQRSQRVSFEAFSQQVVERFEVLETTLRDLAQQMVVLARGVKTAIEHRSNSEVRLDDHERRIAAIEARTSKG